MCLLKQENILLQCHFQAAKVNKKFIYLLKEEEKTV
jgi:hypothetical protein